MSMVAADLLHDFLEEAGDLLDDVDVKLIDLEKSPEDIELLNAVFRGFHTVKGGAGFLEVAALVELCHKGEHLLDALRTRKLTLNAAIMDAILAATAEVRRMFAILADGGTPSPAPAELLAQLQAALEGKAIGTPVGAAAPAPAAGGQEVDWNALFQAVSGTGLEAEPRPGTGYRAPAPVAAAPAPAPAKEGGRGAAGGAGGGNESLRVDLSRFDQILNLTGEIGLAKNRLLNLQRRLLAGQDAPATLKNLEATLKNLNMLVGDLQNAVMKARMQQVGRVFQKYSRMARDLGRQLGKDVELVIEGGDTELDKTLLDELNDPLVHLIRNAVDHGIEDAEARRAAGKPARAVVTLGARQIGDTVVVEIADDGKGMDPAILRRKAFEKGLIDEHDAANLPDSKSYELIFLPGFSTKSEVSSISGRGVGMDVVRTNVARLSGRIRIDSELGRGSRFSVVLPLTLAILPVLTVRLNDQMFALPLTAVLEVIEFPEGEGPIPEEFELEGEMLPVTALAAQLGWVSNRRPAVGVAVFAAGQKVVLAADSFVGRDDVVIKPIQAYRPRGVSGATQSPDGEVVLILDLNELFEVTADV